MNHIYLYSLIIILFFNSCNALNDKSNFHITCISNRQATGYYNPEMEYTKTTGSRHNNYAIKIKNGIIKVYDAEHEMLWSQDSVKFHHEKSGVYYFESVDPDYLEQPAFYSHSTYIFDSNEKTLVRISTPDEDINKSKLPEIIYYID